MPSNRWFGRRNEGRFSPSPWSDFILGSQDGLVNVLGVILGVAIVA